MKLIQDMKTGTITCTKCKKKWKFGQFGLARKHKCRKQKK